MPTNNAIELTQLMGRTLRIPTMSNSTFVVVFEATSEKNSPLRNNIKRKAKVLKNPVANDLCRPFLADLFDWHQDLLGELPAEPPTEKVKLLRSNRT